MHGQFNIPIIGPETRCLGDTSAWVMQRNPVKSKKEKIFERNTKKEREKKIL